MHHAAPLSHPPTSSNSRDFVDQPANPQNATALLSVSDKNGLIDLAKGLTEAGVRLVGSGGTAKAVREAGMVIE